MSLEQEVNEWIDGAAKPRHSLGLLEKYLKKMVLSWGEVKTELKPFHLVFAADNGVISDVKFKTFGCGAAVATSSMATEMIMGKSIDDIEMVDITKI